MWGVFDLEEETHVAPIYSDTQELLYPHILERECPCHPEVEEYEESDVIIHNMFN